MADSDRTGSRSDEARRWLEELGAATARARRAAGLLNSAIIAQRTAEAVHGVLGTDLVSVAVREGSDLVAMRGVSGQRTEAFGKVRVPRGAGIGGKILVVRHPVAVTDYESDPDITHEFVDVVVYGEGLRGMVGVPIIAEREIVGVLYAGRRSSAPVGDHIASLLFRTAEDVGPQLGLALQSERAIQLHMHEERQRIAAELHDTVGQLLFGIGASARRLQGRLPPQAADLLEELRTIEAHASEAASYVRDAVRACTPSPAESLPVCARLAAGEFSERCGILTHVVVIGEPAELSPTVESLLLRVVREGLHNVEKHARAASVVLTLRYEGHEIGVVVQDDGKGLSEGFELQHIPHTSRRWGLASLSQRLESVGGDVVLFPNEDGGVTLRARIPINGEGL